MRVLVTGAQGFTARYLLPALQGEGHEVHGLYRPDQAPDEDEQNVIAHCADLRDRDQVAAVIRDVRPQSVIHLAGIAHVAHSDVREMYETNLFGSRNLLQALAEVGAPDSSVLLASSGNVYGNQHVGRLDEDVSPNPINDYGITKLAMEHLGRMYMDRLPVIIVRPFNYTGVGQSTDFLIPKIVDHARRRAPVIELGNIDVERDFSDVRAVADVYCRLISAPDAVGGTFNICSGRPYSLSAVLSLVEQMSGHRFEVRTNTNLARKRESRSLYGDNSRLVSVLGPVEMPPLETTLRWMIEG